jgi:hypothetical protein
MKQAERKMTVPMTPYQRLEALAEPYINKVEALLR